MCQIHIKEQGVVLPRNFWDSICAANQEGLGLYNIDKNEIFKTQDYEEGWAYINKHKADKMVIHHRLATSGPKTVAQLHGWDMDNGYVFFHNGVLKSYRGSLQQSDTEQFVNDFMGTPIKAMVKYLEEVESSSRFILIHKETGDIIRPDCAKWNPVYIHELGQEVIFSNDYAFSYSKLPPAYSRWGGYDNDWDDNSTAGYFTRGYDAKKTRVTRSGAKTKKRVTSVFESSLNLAGTIEVKGTITRNVKRNVWSSPSSPIEFLSEPVNPTDAKLGVYKMPDIVRLAGTDNYIFGAELLAVLRGSKASADSVLDDSFGSIIMMNDVMDCGSADIAKVYVRLARRGLEPSVVTNAALYKYIRSYEMRIGKREEDTLSLQQFLDICTRFETDMDAIDSKADPMLVSSMLLEVVSEELTTNKFKYFKSFATRVIKQATINIKDELKVRAELAERAKSGTRYGSRIGGYAIDWLEDENYSYGGSDKWTRNLGKATR